MPGRIDETITFQPLRIALLTVSDTRSIESDKSGGVLAEKIGQAGHHLVEREIIKDELETITELFRKWVADPKVEVVISTGGTGVTGRDVTPEALDQVAEKKVPGFGELFRYLTLDKIGTSTIQSRADAGVANGTYIFVLPGSPGACRDAWDGILLSQLDIRHKPCNFAELIPRLKEG